MTIRAIRAAADEGFDTNIPIPARRNGQPSAYAGFAVGFSKFYPNAARERLYPALSYYGQRNKQKFVTRTVTEGGVKGIRVWRIE